MQQSAGNLAISGLPTNVLGFFGKLQKDGLLDSGAECCVFTKMPFPKNRQCCSVDRFF